MKRLKKKKQNNNSLQNNLDKIDYLYTVKNTQSRIIKQLAENNKKNIFLNSKITKIENDIRLLMIFFQNKERDHQREKELQKALTLKELDKIREEHKLIISEIHKKNQDTISELKTALQLQKEQSDKFKNEMKIVLQYLFKMTNDIKEDKEKNEKTFKVLDDITKTLTTHVKTISLYIKDLNVSNLKTDKITEIMNKRMTIMKTQMNKIREEQEFDKIAKMYQTISQKSNSPKNK